MKTFKITISGSGTANQLAISLLQIGRMIQVADIYENDIEGEYEDSILITEIKED